MVSGKCDSIELTCNMIKIVMKSMITHRQARTATPVIKLNGFTICSVDTGWAERSSAPILIFLLPSWKLQPVFEQMMSSYIMKNIFLIMHINISKIFQES